MKTQYINYLSLILLSFTLVCAYYYSLSRDFYYFQQDAEVDYFINSLLIAKGQISESFHHPGLILQYFGGILFKNLFSSNIENTSNFLNIIKYVLFSINILILIIAFKLQEKEYLKLLILILILLSFPAFLYYSDYYTVDNLVITFSLILFIQSLKVLSNESKFKDIFILSIISSLCLSLKFIFLPFYLIILFCLFLKDLKKYILFKNFDFIKSFLLYFILTTLFFLLLNFIIVDKLPYLLLNTLYSIFSSFFNLRFLLLFIIFFIFFIFILIYVLKYKNYLLKNIITNNESIKIIFIMLGICFFLLNCIKINYQDSFYLGVSTRHISAYYVFIVYPIIFFTNKKYLVIPILFFTVLSGIFVYDFVNDRNKWINNSKNINLQLSNYISENYNEESNIIIWTGSGNNNYFKETFFMWGDYRYNKERYKILFSNNFPRIRMLRLRTLLEDNNHSEHNKSRNIVEKISNFKIFYNETNEINYGNNLNLDKSIFIIKENEIFSELKFLDEKNDFKNFLETKINKKFKFNKLNFNGNNFLIFE
jgi:hypothetical protein